MRGTVRDQCHNASAGFMTNGKAASEAAQHNLPSGIGHGQEMTHKRSARDARRREDRLVVHFCVGPPSRLCPRCSRPIPGVACASRSGACSMARRTKRSRAHVRGDHLWHLRLEHTNTRRYLWRWRQRRWRQNRWDGRAGRRGRTIVGWDQ